MDYNNSLVTVILPIYNVKNYLSVCMDSIFAQTYTNLEILMIDDGSTDGSAEICDEYAKKDARVTVYHKANGGLSDARNYGIARAKGNYITCIDSDDYVDADYVQYLYRLLKKYHSKMSICQHRVKYDNRHMIEYGREGQELLDNKTCIERMLYHDVIDTSAWGKLYAKELFHGILYPKGRIFEDIATTYRLMLQCDRIAVGYESKYNYICRSTSIVNCGFHNKKLDLLEMTDRMAMDVLNHYPDLSDAVLRRRVYARISTLNQMLRTKEFPEKKRELIMFIRKYKKNILKDIKAPKRDKAAVILLSISFYLYRFVWLGYQRYVLNK